MAQVEVDVVVIGLGPGGEALATELARHDLDVVAVERHLVGGECPYYGCIPSKMMVRAADVLAEARRVSRFAGRADVQPDWAPVHARIRDEATTDWHDTAAVERLRDAGVRFVRGHGRLVAPRTVEVETGSATGTEETYAARIGIVLNTGTSPVTPPIPGLDATPYWTNRNAVRAAEMPGSLIVIGGGAVGVEMAQAFARFGAEVTVVEAADRILAVEEPEAGELVARLLVDEGIRVLTSAHVESVGHGDRFTVHADGRRLHADRLLVATGRRANLDDVGLDAVGLDPEARFVPVDDRMRAGDGLWAIGDITGKGAFTHVSMYQAAVARRDILGEPGPPADYRALPHVTFTDPEVGSVGLTEGQARDRGIAVGVGRTDLSGSTRGWIAGAEGLVKLVADTDRQVLVGATVVAPAGGEVLSMLALAVHARTPLATLRSMIYAYPTFHRAVESALADLP